MTGDALNEAPSRLRFRFDEDRLVQAVAYLWNKGVHDLTLLKAAKLLYFADKEHLLKYGRPITGDQYNCLPLGPVPTLSLDYLREAQDAASLNLPFREGFDRTLEVQRRPWWWYPRFAAKGHQTFDALSPSDREVLDHIAATLGRLSARKLVDLSHNEAGWRKADASRPPAGRTELPYEYFFEGAPPEAQHVLELARAEQEDRDFAAALTR